MKNKPLAYMTFTLHAHLPYVVNHGTWPHGLEWLLEAAAETYLPLIRVFRNLEADGIGMHCNLNLSPILLEQLSHPVFKAEFPEYLKRKILSAREDEEYFRQAGDEHFVYLAGYWRKFFQTALDDFEALERDIIKGFRRLNENGLIEIITCAATHGYFPLLGNDESILAQVKTGVATHKRHIGKQPRGIWAPECGYRPAGLWQPPMPREGEEALRPPFERFGSEEALAQGGIEYFFVDTHLVEQAVSFTPYDLLAGAKGADEELAKLGYLKSVYSTYYVDGPEARKHPVTIFPRDPRTGLQVWSGDAGYPGDGNYLDFHKKRWPGGHRYWQVTHSKADLADKTPYHPDWASARTKAHAEHFVQIVAETLKPSFRSDIPPILTSPFDAELFGHWWYEGPQWLEHVARLMAREDFPVKLISGGKYLDTYPVSGFMGLPEGSWGKNGTNEVWLNPDTSWTWTHIYTAEDTVRTLATEGKWKDGGLGEQIMKQMCRELLLMESSDWQFLITTEAARDYAEARFMTHVEQFKAVETAWKEWSESGALGEATQREFERISLRDNIFPDVDPALWSQLP